jgi:hypothetical protein
MSDDDGTKVIHMGTPEADVFFANTRRAMKITPAINRLASKHLVARVLSPEQMTCSAV